MQNIFFKKRTCFNKKYLQYKMASASPPPYHDEKFGWPTACPTKLALQTLLQEFGWPPGLQTVLEDEAKEIAFRFCILDNSGSMTREDGQILVYRHRQWHFDKCTRWEELTHNFAFHVRLAAALPLPTEFRVLNGWAPITVGALENNTNDGVTQLQAILRSAPAGGTPLCRHIHAIVRHIKEQLLTQLLAEKKKVVVVIATDGIDDAGTAALTAALKNLEHLPVWVVIRLCTNDKDVVDYWNNIDSQLELNIDIIDDLASEATEVWRHNPWLTYGAPLHQLREAGVTLKEFDVMDEAPLSNRDMWSYIAKLLHHSMEAFPNPVAGRKKFWQAVQPMLQNMPAVWDPISHKTVPWLKIPTTFADKIRAWLHIT